MSQPPVGGPRGPQGQAPVRIDRLEEYAQSLVGRSETLDKLPAEKGLVQSYIRNKVLTATRDALRDVHDHGYPQGRRPDEGVLKLRTYLARYDSPHAAHDKFVPSDTAKLAEQALDSQRWASSIPPERRPGLDAYLRSEAAAAGEAARDAAESWAAPLRHPAVDERQRQAVNELDAFQDKQQEQNAQRMLSGTPYYHDPEPPVTAPQVATPGRGWGPDREQSQQY